MGQRVTLADVAAHAGVSRATVSLVLRNTGRVSEATRARVRKSMQALGYVYHRGAASLRSQRSHSIGLVVSDISNLFNAELSIGLESALADEQVVTLTCSSLEDPVRQDMLVRAMLERQVDAILIIPVIGTSRRFAETLRRCPVPALVASRELPDSDATYIGIDNHHGGRLAAEHLLTHGVTEVGYLGGFTELGPRNERLAGAKHVLREAGVPLVCDRAGPPHGSWGLHEARGLLSTGLPQGLICHNDQVAFGVYRAMREARLPAGAVRVVSFDDVAEAALWEPPLTSVAASGHQVGLRCAEVLIRCIAEPDAAAERSLILPRITVRQSCGCD